MTALLSKWVLIRRINVNQEQIKDPVVINLIIEANQEEEAFPVVEDEAVEMEAIKVVEAMAAEEEAVEEATPEDGPMKDSNLLLLLDIQDVQVSILESTAISIK